MVSISTNLGEFSVQPGTLLHGMLVACVAARGSDLHLGDEVAEHGTAFRVRTDGLLSNYQPCRVPIAHLVKALVHDFAEEPSEEGEALLTALVPDLPDGDYDLMWTADIDGSPTRWRVVLFVDDGVHRLVARHLTL